MVALEILSSIFTPIWGLFTSVQIPGLGVSYGAFLLAVIIARLSRRPGPPCLWLWRRYRIPLRLCQKSQNI